MKNLDIDMNLRNKYRIRICDSQTGRLKNEIHFHNTVTDYWKYEMLQDFMTSGSNHNFYLFLGTGEGTHTSADTTLFNPIYNRSLDWYSSPVSHTFGNTFWSYKFSVVLDESVANGILTEIALSVGKTQNQPNKTYCIANFQDSEGHPISIEKTDTDTLTLDIELELSLDVSRLPDNIKINLDFANGDGSRGFKESPMMPTRTDIEKIPTVDREVGHSNSPAYYYNGTILSWMLWCANSAAYLSLNTDKNLGYTDEGSPICSITGSWSSTIVDSKKVNRVSFSEVAKSAEGNLTDSSEIYQIMSLGFLLNSVSLCINLPDHEIFPPTEMEFKIVGDGVTTDFNLPIPILMKDRGCIVTANNQIIPDSEYDWYGINYQMVQSWGLNDWSKVIDYSSYYASSNGSGRGIATSPYLSKRWRGLGNEFIEYDFGEPITVDCVGRLSNLGVSGTPSIKYKINFEDEWITIKSWASSDTSATIEHLDTPITARYWRVEPCIRSSVSTSTSTQRTAFPLFGRYEEISKPTIHFHNPLPADQITIIKAWTEYPCKSEDWIYKTISIDISKGAVD